MDNSFIIAPWLWFLNRINNATIFAAVLYICLWFLIRTVQYLRTLSTVNLSCVNYSFMMNMALDVSIWYIMYIQYCTFNFFAYAYMYIIIRLVILCEACTVCYTREEVGYEMFKLSLEWVFIWLVSKLSL